MTHESQPLDASIFKPLKQNWQDVCHQYVQDNPGKGSTTESSITVTVMEVTVTSVAHVGTKSRKVIDTNQCCICYSGLEWMECVCMRWPHEQCIDYNRS